MCESVAISIFILYVKSLLLSRKIQFNFVFEKPIIIEKSGFPRTLRTDFWMKIFYDMWILWIKKKTIGNFDNRIYFLLLKLDTATWLLHELPNSSLNIAGASDEQH